MCADIPSLSRKETLRLLNSKSGLVRLGTVDSDGRPHVVPVWFVYRRGTFYIPSPMKSLKTTNTRERPDVCLVIDSYGGKLDARGLLFKGKASIITGKRSRRINYLIHQKYMGARKIRESKWRKFMAEDDATIVLRSRKSRSWDFSKLDL